MPGGSFKLCYRNQTKTQKRIKRAKTARNTLPISRAYLKLKDDTCFYGATAETNLQAIIEAVETTAWAGLTAVQKDGLAEMYRTFRTVMDSWTIENIKNYA